MSEIKDLPATPAAAENLVSGSPASRASAAPQSYAEVATGSQVATTSGASTPDTEPKPGEASTSEENVVRARRRRDAIAPEVQRAALDATMRYLGSMSRTPFRRVLAELLECKPTPEGVRRFADKYPDRWAQAVSMMAGLSGFDRGVVEVNVFNVKGMADAELMRELQMVRAELLRVAPRAVPVEVVDAEVVSEEKK